MILNGSCFALRAYDIGVQIDIDAGARLLEVTSERITIVPRHKAPKHFDYKSRPLHLRQAAESLKIGSFSSLAAVELMLFEFGTVSVAYRIPFKASLSELIELSDALYDNATLRQDSQRRVEELLTSIRRAVVRPLISGFVEDYMIFEVTRGPADPLPQELLKEYRQQIAQILSSEKIPLSEQEVNDAMAEQISYSPQDSAILNWNAAFLYGPDAEDVRSVLEFANVQLLEMRYLDHQLDNSLEESYELLTRHRAKSLNIFRAFSRDLKRVARMQIDGALLFEGVSNALKLLGDQYLARVYRMAARRFYLADWDRSIARKLSALESIYQKLEDQVASRRMELLELVIVVLILIEIIMAFIPGLSH